MNLFSKLLIFFSAVFLFFSCDSPETNMEKVNFLGETQGTYYSVIYFDTEGRNFQLQIDSILNAFDQSVSMWVDTSIISCVNRGDSTVVLDQWFLDNFNISKRIASETDGAFDFTVGALVRAWGFGPQGPSALAPDKIDSLMQFTGYENVSIEEGRVKVQQTGVQFDFNAVAQGYSVDLLATYLEDQGIENYLVDIGGEVFAKGKKPNGKFWVVGIEKPSDTKDDGRAIQLRVELKSKALATSGSYRKYYESGGQRFSHSIDPATGRPVSHKLLSVSVLAPRCADADAYATAFMVMGTEKALSFVEDRKDLEAYFISDAPGDGFELKMSSGFTSIILEE